MKTLLFSLLFFPLSGLAAGFTTVSVECVTSTAVPGFIQWVGTGMGAVNCPAGRTAALVTRYVQSDSSLEAQVDSLQIDVTNLKSLVSTPASYADFYADGMSLGWGIIGATCAAFSVIFLVRLLK